MRWNTPKATCSTRRGARYEGTRGYEKEHHWDFDGSAVYEMNYREQGKLEIGYQYTSYSEHGDYNITYWTAPRRISSGRTTCTPRSSTAARSIRSMPC